MKVAVLPFNAAEGTKPALGRQFAAFASEQLRAHAEADINTVSYLTQIQQPDGTSRTALVNIAETLLPYDQLTDLFNQAEVELVKDGTLSQTGDSFDITVRFTEMDREEPIYLESKTFKTSVLFTELLSLFRLLAS